MGVITDPRNCSQAGLAKSQPPWWTVSKLNPLSSRERPDSNHRAEIAPTFQGIRARLPQEEPRMRRCSLGAQVPMAKHLGFCKMFHLPRQGFHEEPCRARGDALGSHRKLIALEIFRCPNWQGKPLQQLGNLPLRLVFSHPEPVSDMTSEKPETHSFCTDF